MKLGDIAKSITAHLKRFEADPVINSKDVKYDTSPYWYSHAWAAGSRVAVQYVSYQGHSKMTKSEALAYLVWLNSGNVGKHWEALKEPNAIAN